MTGSAPASRPGPSPTSAASPVAGKCRFLAGFHSKLRRLDLPPPATVSGNSIYELDFGRFCDRDSGHFRSVFGGRSLGSRFGNFPAMRYCFGHPRAAGAWAL
ncbi:unnamed protein product [Prunus armeniaca]